MSGLNERTREAAHRILDEVLREAAGKRDYFGRIGVLIDWSNGKPVIIRPVREQTMKTEAISVEALVGQVPKLAERRTEVA